MKYPVHAIVYHATRGKSCEAFFKTGVKRPVDVALPPLSWGHGGDASPHKAQSRHRGARSAIASAMSDLCKIASRYAP